MAKLTTAWKKARVQMDVKANTDASQKIHGEPIQMLPAIMKKFKEAHGKDLEEEEFASASIFRRIPGAVGNWHAESRTSLASHQHV